MAQPRCIVCSETMGFPVYHHLGDCPNPINHRYRLTHRCKEHNWGCNVAPCPKCKNLPPVADASKEGRKVGKVRMDLVMQDMPRAIEALARVMTWALGEKGYKESDWLHVPDAINKYSGGMHRHDNKEKRGQEFDDESGLEHAIHTAWNAMARVELILRKKEAQ